MTATLRPMNLGEILDRTVQIYSAKFLVFVGIAVLPTLAALTLQLAGYLLGRIGLLPIAPTDIRNIFRQLGLWLDRGDIEAYFICLVSPVVAYSASRAYLNERLTLASSLNTCMEPWRSWVSFGGALWIIVSLFPTWLERMFTLRQAHPYLVVVLLMVPGWVVGGLLSMKLSISIPVWAVEGLPVGQTLRRGWELTRGGNLKLFITWFLMCLIQVLASLSVGVVSFLAVWGVGRILRQPDLLQRNYRTFGSILTEVASILTTPLYPIAITLFYYDQRIRQEGYDIEKMMDAAGMNRPLPSSRQESPAAPVAEEVQD